MSRVFGFDRERRMGFERDVEAATHGIFGPPPYRIVSAGALRDFVNAVVTHHLD